MIFACSCGREMGARSGILPVKNRFPWRYVWPLPGHNPVMSRKPSKYHSAKKLWKALAMAQARVQASKPKGAWKAGQTGRSNIISTSVRDTWTLLQFETKLGLVSDDDKESRQGNLRQTVNLLCFSVSPLVVWVEPRHKQYIQEDTVTPYHSSYFKMITQYSLDKKISSA